MTIERERQPIKIVKFIPESHKILSDGFLVYIPTVQSIATLREDGRKFSSIWHKNYPDFENKTSRLSEIAIPKNPKQFFLPNSNFKTLSEQEEMIAKYSEELLRKIPGIKAILGEVPDYLELTILHFMKTQETLFGEKYYNCFTRTKTQTADSRSTLVGRSATGFNIVRWPNDEGHYSLFAAPLIVPDEK